QALKPVASRIVIEGLTGIEGKKRRLHAKLALLRGRTGTWIVAGSANLTRPAWLKTAHEDGNLEAVTLRYLPGKASPHPLLASVRLKAVKLSTLSYEQPSEADDPR